MPKGGPWGAHSDRFESFRSRTEVINLKCTRINTSLFNFLVSKDIYSHRFSKP